jgi:DNA helicase-2/ATP-dependent DNA helicase PcrA
MNDNVRQTGALDETAASEPAQRGDPLARLNPAQREAACWGERGARGVFRSDPLLVIAGAGTGKTMTLAHRVANLVIEGVDPERILLLTFTRRAAEEMLRRARSIVRAAMQLGEDSAAVRFTWSGTFHSVANRLLRHYAANVGLDPAFSVLDRGDAADLMDLVRHEQGLSARTKRFPKKDTCLAIYSRCVNAQEDLTECLRSTYPWCGDWEPELRGLFRGYVEAKQQNQALDYDDLLLYWYHLVSDAELAAAIGARFDHVLVDEYQDTNRLQAEILHAIKPTGEGVTIVGDDAQSIYAFRAAEVENILDFPERYTPPAKVVRLEQNYRSVRPILDTANTLITEGKRQYRKRLWSEMRSRRRPAYVTVEDVDAESDYVVRRVLENREAGLALRQQAVLFRGAHSSDRLELELVRRNIPYVKYGGLKFLESAHVKDLLAVLKWADNPKNRVAAFRVLKLLEGMGPAHAGRCFEYVAAADYALSSLGAFRAPAAAREDWPGLVSLMGSLASAPPAGAWQGQIAEARRWYQPHLERLYDASEQRAADIEQLEMIAGRYASRERFLSELTLDPPRSTGDLSADPLLDEDYLILSTVHSAKGQEWDAVFVLNVSDGSFPSEFSTASPDLIEEERRLLYVAMTRAKRQLHLVAPLRYHVTQQHRHGDRHVYGARSRFLTDAVMATLEPVFHAAPGSADGGGLAASGRRVDVAGRLRSMW